MKLGNLRTVLVTGASGGIGREISVYFANNGWNVICHYNSSKSSVEELENYFIENGVSYKMLKCDFSDSTYLNNFIDEISYFEIDSLINNVGISMECCGLQDIMKVFTVNTFSAMMITAKVFVTPSIANLEHP